MVFKKSAWTVLCAGLCGGLIAGTATALRGIDPSIEVYAVEPAGFDDTARSLTSGRRESNDPAARSFCDALLAPTPGALTFSINRTLLAGGISVDDREVAQAIRFAFRDLKLVVEPGGAVALAALLAGKFEARGKTVALTLTGANVDAATFARILSSDEAG